MYVLEVIISLHSHPLIHTYIYIAAGDIADVHLAVGGPGHWSGRSYGVLPADSQVLFSKGRHDIHGSWGCLRLSLLCGHKYVVWVWVGEGIRGSRYEGMCKGIRVCSCSYVCAYADINFFPICDPMELDLICSTDVS